jgi:glycine/D-amino acid oxidase-like deaminating enzyme
VRDALAERAAIVVLVVRVELPAAQERRVMGSALPRGIARPAIPLGPRLAEAIVYRGAVTDTDLANNHYRIVGNDRLLWSGHTTTWEADPKHYVRRLKADMTAVYPQLGEVEVEHAWSGVLGNALHRMPQIGELSSGVAIVRAIRTRLGRRPARPRGDAGVLLVV